MKNYHPITLLMLASGILQSQDVSKIPKEPWDFTLGTTEAS
ncbi:MAG: hypothetical protein K0S12_2541 [Bacteroidetes bacterium]|jgi:hypothetical protein|nr:hypothetical protein [Bacteroidota bacterium]